MSSMLSAPATIPATSATIFAAAFAPPLAAIRTLGDQPAEPAPGRQRQHRRQPDARHEIRIIEPHRHRAASMR
jgi:hypothetical protein